MDIISFNEAATANSRIEKFIENPDSTSGVVTVPKVIASGETITIPAGRVAILPNVQIDGVLNVENGGEVFIPSGATFGGVVEKVTSTDNAIVRFDGTTGKVQNSGVIIDDNGNVGIGTSSPANIKFNRTFTTQVTGIASVAMTVGDYSSNTSATITAVESLGNRHDSNGSFGGRFGASYRRSDGAAIPSGNTIGYYAFGGQWGTDVGYTPSKHLYAASICGVSEGSFTSASAMATGISFRTGSSGHSLGDVNTTYGTERMRIDSAGNVLVTGGGGLGYGTGSGGLVIQLTSKSTAVTLNKPTGYINMINGELAAGASVTFTFNNSKLSANDTLNISIYSDSIATQGSYRLTWSIKTSLAYITLTNQSASALNEAPLFNFAIIKGATA